MNIRNLLLAFILFFAGFQPVAQALALGELELKSHLNQPLNVVIPLEFSNASALDDLQLRLTRPDAQAAGLQYLQNLKVEIIENDGNQPYLRITSNDNLHEPTLSFVLDMRWSTGRIQRSYSLLIDPKP